MSTATAFEILTTEISALRGSPLIAIHVDDFLNPSKIRHRRGRQSPEGFWLDSYD
ncbi:hypothetical protein ACSW29_08165 [Rhodococcus sp. GB-02]